MTDSDRLAKVQGIEQNQKDAQNLFQKMYIARFGKHVGGDIFPEPNVVRRLAEEAFLAIDEFSATFCRLRAIEHKREMG